MRRLTLALLGAGALGALTLAGCGSDSPQPVSAPSAQPPAGPQLAAGPGSTDAQSFQAGGEPTAAQLQKSLGNFKAPAGTPVVWRMDDIQAWYCSSIINDLVQPFLNSGTPLTMGIIGTGFSGDQSIVDRMAGLAKNPLIQIASHSFSHPAAGLPALGGETAQQSDLQQAQDMIKQTTGVTPDTFIAPENVYDDNTVTAMKATGLTSMSAECTWTATGTTEFCPTGSGVVAPNLTWDGLTMMPAGAVIDSWTDFTQPASATTALTWAQAQIKNQGFAVFMLHPQELAQDSATCKATDQTKLNVIKSVIQQGKQQGWQFYTMAGLKQAEAQSAG